MTRPVPTFHHAGLRLHVDRSADAGAPVFFQHGLCGDARQTAEAFPPAPGFRRITLECRGHGASEAGPFDQLGIATFADDLAALIEVLGAAPAVVGGISMGAAIALRLAVRRPDLVRGLMLVRPAWATAAAPANLAANAEVGALLGRLGPSARARFAASPTAAALAARAPDNLASLLGFFERTPTDVTAALLTRLARDGPGVEAADLRRVTVPTLVVGHDRDEIHPLAHARALADLIPAARLVEITPKATDRDRYVADLGACLAAFLRGLA